MESRDEVARLLKIAWHCDKYLKMQTNPNIFSFLLSSGDIKLFSLTPASWQNKVVVQTLSWRMPEKGWSSFQQKSSSGDQAAGTSVPMQNKVGQYKAWYRCPCPHSHKPMNWHEVLVVENHMHKLWYLTQTIFFKYTFPFSLCSDCLVRWVVKYVLCFNTLLSLS